MMELADWLPFERIKLALACELEVALLFARQKVFDWIRSEKIENIPDQIDRWNAISEELHKEMQAIMEWGLHEAAKVATDMGLRDHNKAFQPWFGSQPMENDHRVMTNRAVEEALYYRDTYLPPISEEIWKMKYRRDGMVQSLCNIMRHDDLKDLTVNNLIGVFEVFFDAKVQTAKWNAKRLYRMTPSQRKRSKEGLKPALNQGRSRGVSYFHIRLARTEIAALQLTMAKLRYDMEPWVESADWTLSPGHPQSDICDSLAKQSPYRIRDVPNLPHPNCLCIITPNVMPNRKYANKVDGWIKGDNDFLDQYQEFMQMDRIMSETVLQGDLHEWLFEEKVPESPLGFRSKLGTTRFHKKETVDRQSYNVLTRLATGNLY